MERNEISKHEVEVYRVLSTESRWLTNAEIADLASDVAVRTVRLHTRRFADLGLVDQAEVFPAHRYRWAEKADKRNQAYVLRLQRAMEVFA